MPFNVASTLAVAFLSSQPSPTIVADGGAQGGLPSRGGDGATVASSPDAPVSPAPPKMGKGGSEMSDMDLMPPGIMTGEAGKWMASYSYTYERRAGNLIGNQSISNAEILQQFQSSPTDMTMQMHMGSLMYAPTDRLTLMAMAPYQSMVMNHVNRAGDRFQETSSGFGDIDLSGSYLLYTSSDLHHRLLIDTGVSLPTGSINKRMMGMRLEYPMQLGSGTVALLPGFIYLGQAKRWGWGAKFDSTLQLGRNSYNYTLGNRYEVSAWVTRLLTDTVSMSAGLNGQSQGNIRGADPVLDPLDEPTKDPLRQGGRWLDANLGVAFHPHNGVLNGDSFFLNAALPMAQSLDGPQLKQSFGLEFAVQREF